MAQTFIKNEFKKKFKGKKKKHCGVKFENFRLSSNHHRQRHATNPAAHCGCVQLDRAAPKSLQGEEEETKLAEAWLSLT